MIQSGVDECAFNTYWENNYSEFSENSLQPNYIRGACQMRVNSNSVIPEL